MQHSYWENTSFFCNADFAIVGAGFLGLFTSLELKSKYPNKSIVILEKNNLPYGASTRNAGFACFGSPTELIADAKNNGVEVMLHTTEQRFKGIEKIKKIFNPYSIEYDACGGFECISNRLNNIPALQDNIQELNQQLALVFNKKNVFENITNQLQELGLQNFDALYKNALEGGLHSGKLMQLLIQKAFALGISILYNSPVTNITTLSNTVELQLPTNTIKAQHVIVCTNAFVNTLLVHENVVPARGQIFITKPIDDLQMKGTFHYNEGYYYWRNVGNRILLGGARNSDMENEQTTSFSTTATIQQQLIQFAQEHFVHFNTESIDYSWSGIMAFTNNKLPLVKSINSQITMAIGCNGIGVALTPMLAEVIANKV
jgi:gamma-glutamylputrescine oxidase